MAQFLELSVSLSGVLPRPVRRFRIRHTATFADLHAAIMAATGWSGSHLWAFTAERLGEETPIAAPCGPDGEYLAVDGFPAPPADRIRLARHLGPAGATECRYLYDFGDGWECRVLVHDLLVLHERAARRWVGAEFPWPPDDCGGPFGYARLQEALRTGEDPEGLLAWARETWGWTGRVDEAALRRAFDGSGDEAPRARRRRGRGGSSGGAAEE